YYSKACELEAEFVKLTTIEELAKSDLQDKIAVLSGELTEEQLMPKSFTFYNPERHQRIISLLEQKAPQAIITVVDNDTSVFEDGDFQIPSAYISKAEGQKLLNGQGRVGLNINTTRKDSRGANLIARINPAAEKKLVITAHMDTKYGTPGALDDGTGIAILLLLSSIIKPDDIDFTLELLLLNGEDYYSTPGQLKYMEEYIEGNESTFLVINCDGVGLKDSKTAIAFMELAAARQNLVKDLISAEAEFELIEPWEMGDHMLFVMHGIPAITFTSKEILNLIDEIAHTEKDAINLIDYCKVMKVIEFIADIVVNINN
ncbi:MAG: M28 family metallopeptidase, partial [Bacillota bacterium]